MILYIHGAGWVFGNAHTHDRLVRELAVGAGAAVVFPDYDLSPEARYPVGHRAELRGRAVDRRRRRLQGPRRLAHAPSPATPSAATWPPR